MVAIGGSLTLYAIRAPALKGGGLFAPISREGALVLNNLLLSCGCATVFLGTLYPLFLDAVGGPKLSVGFPFFNRTFAPMMVPLIIAVGVGPMLAWKRGDLLGALQRLWAAYIAAGAGRCWSRCYVTYGGPVLAVLGFGLAAWTGVARDRPNSPSGSACSASPFGDSLRRAIHLPRAAYGMTFAHLGLAVSVAGFAASAFDARSDRHRARRRRLSRIAGYELHFDGRGHACPARTSPPIDATIGVTPRRPAWSPSMHPERRFFPLQQQTTSETAIRTNFLADLYVALGDPRQRGQLDRPRLLEAAGAVDLDRRDHHGVRRRGQPERPPLAGRRGGARPPRGAPVLQPAAGRMSRHAPRSSICCRCCCSWCWPAISRSRCGPATTRTSCRRR